MSNPDAPRPDVPAPSPVMMMILLGRRLEARVEAELKAMGLSMRRLGVLGHLRREPGISFSALARRAGIKVQSLHPVMDALTDEGYVATVGSRGQGRAAVIELTPRGREALDAANRMIAEIDRTAFVEDYERDTAAALVAWAAALRRSREEAAAPS
ncbi:MarR family winged helix-turn-helix transcriptional regulator [Microbacterium sp. RD1]|uniref:MarR family winged helix-turn-helix transcriptional regulator n=1 Tax=Microbacterium sp. RD1 TaxID=3457313 RepID=UPI003FA5441D